MKIRSRLLDTRDRKDFIQQIGTVYLGSNLVHNESREFKTT